MRKAKNLNKNLIFDFKFKKMKLEITENQKKWGMIIGGTALIYYILWKIGSFK